MIINALTVDDIHRYMKKTNMYYDIIDEEKCQNIEDIKLADSILFEGERVYKYKEEERYNKVIEFLSLFN
jgi:hypothetical protein